MSVTNSRSEKVLVGLPQQTANTTELLYSRLSVVVVFLFTTPSHVRATIHQSRAVVSQVLFDQSAMISPITSSSAQSRTKWKKCEPPEKKKERGKTRRWNTARTNVTTTKSLGFRFEEACLSAAHANAARAMGSTVSEESSLLCKNRRTTTGSEGPLKLLRRSDRE